MNYNGGGYMGGLMNEKIIKIEKSKVKGKKYTAKVKNKKTGKTRKINFGAKCFHSNKQKKYHSFMFFACVCIIIFMSSKFSKQPFPPHFFILFLFFDEQHLPQKNKIELKQKKVSNNSATFFA